MILYPYTYNGTSLQSTDFETSIPRQSALAQLEANLVYVRRAGASPLYAGKDLQPVTLNLEIILKHDFMTLIETLNQVFNVHDKTPYKFAIQDTEDSNKQYYVYATTKRVMAGHDGSMAVVTLGFDDPVWQTETQNSQAWNITASGQSTDFVNSGNIEAYPIYEIAVTGYPVTGWVFNNYVEYIPNSTGWANRPLEILSDTNGVGMDTAALVSGGKAQSDGDDFRVLVDGVQVDRWFGGAGFNTTDTKCFINIDQPPKRTLTLKTAIDSTSPSTSVEFVYNTTSRNHFRAMPAKGRFKIGTEEFTYTSKTITTTTLIANNVTRAVRNTSAGSHAANATVTWIPYDINIIYGSSDAAAPDVDDTLQPILNLSTSWNSSFVYASFKDIDSLRSGIWSSQISSVTNVNRSISKIYTGANDGGDTNPAAVAGMMIGAYQSAGVWRAETSILSWLLGIPDGVASVAFDYERYQYNASTPSVIGLQASTDGITWTNAEVFSTLPTTDLQTWVTGSVPSTDVTIPTGAKFIRFIESGTVTARANNVVYFGATGATVGITTPPTISRRGEQSNYQFSGTFSNGATGESLTVNYPMHVGDTLIIDTDPNFPTATLNGQIVNGIISTDTIRADLLSLAPGTNTITFTSNEVVGTATVTVKWRDRMNYL